MVLRPSNRYHPLVGYILDLQIYRVSREFLLLNSNASYACFASNSLNLGTDWHNEVVEVPVPDDSDW